MNTVGSFESERTVSQRLWFHKRALIAIGAAIAIAVFLGWYFRFHLLWKYLENTRKAIVVHAIPNTSMPLYPVPDDWVPCRVDGIELKLPPQIAQNREVGVSLVGFSNGALAVDVDVPDNINALQSLLHAATQASPTSQVFTMPRFRLACCQASSDDFRWSMSPAEAHWHTFLVATRLLLRFTVNEKDAHTETLFRKDLDGLLYVGHDGAMFEWQSNNKHGFIHFVVRKQNLDLVWVRTACQSLKIQ